MEPRRDRPLDAGGVQEGRGAGPRPHRVQLPLRRVVLRHAGARLARGAQGMGGAGGPCAVGDRAADHAPARGERAPVHGEDRACAQAAGHGDGRDAGRPETENGGPAGAGCRKIGADMDLDLAFVRDGLITFILLVACIAFHEWGHAIVADMLGDDTPRADGRVTLNPMAHLDMMGTVFIPLVNIFVFGGGLPFIGWGKPVITNPSNYRNRWRDDILIAAAGPAANLLFALAAIIVGSLVVP